jgi:hypothetical protein
VLEIPDQATLDKITQDNYDNIISLLRGMIYVGAGVNLYYKLANLEWRAQKGNPVFFHGFIENYLSLSITFNLRTLETHPILETIDPSDQFKIYEGKKLYVKQHCLNAQLVMQIINTPLISNNSKIIN